MDQKPGINLASFTFWAIICIIIWICCILLARFIWSSIGGF